MKADSKLALHCSDAHVAGELEKVLSPDNTGVPGSQRFSMSKRGRTLAFDVESDYTSSFSTLLSVLWDASLFQEIWLLSREGRAGVGSPEDR